MIYLFVPMTVPTPTPIQNADAWGNTPITPQSAPTPLPKYLDILFDTSSYVHGTRHLADSLQKEEPPQPQRVELPFLTPISLTVAIPLGDIKKRPVAQLQKKILKSWQS